MSGMSIIGLRMLHILASVCWAGGGFVFFLFVEPTARALAPSGMQFVNFMVKKRRFSIFMVVSSTFTVLTGALLILARASGQWLSYVSSGPGLVFTLGSITGIAVYFVGMLGVNPRAIKLSKLGEAIQASGNPPTPEQGALMQKLGKEMGILSLVDFLLVALSLVLMSSARFFVL